MVKYVKYRVEEDGKYYVDLFGKGDYGVVFKNFVQMRKYISPQYKLKAVKYR